MFFHFHFHVIFLQIPGHVWTNTRTLFDPRACSFPPHLSHRLHMSTIFLQTQGAFYCYFHEEGVSRALEWAYIFHISIYPNLVKVEPLGLLEWVSVSSLNIFSVLYQSFIVGGDGLNHFLVMTFFFYLKQLHVHVQSCCMCMVELMGQHKMGYWLEIYGCDFFLMSFYIFL